MLAGPEDVAWFRLEDTSAIGEVRRSIAALAGRVGFAPTRVAEVSIAATELATNAVVHATRGSALVRVRRDRIRSAIELVVTDGGPGIADLAAALVDGESSRGTLGVGLGAAVRLANHFEAYSTCPTGSIMWASFLPELATPIGPLDVDGVTRPITGELICGDAWAAAEDADRIAVLLADGLGHGELAAQASRAAVDAFAADPWSGPHRTIDQVHRRLHGTRGAAVLALEMDRSTRQLRWAGVGNIAGRVVGPSRTTNLSSQPGIVGQRMPRVREEHLALEAGTIVVVHSDGLTSKWVLEDFRGLVLRSSTVIAAALLQWAGLRHDDASVVAIRER